MSNLPKKMVFLIGAMILSWGSKSASAAESEISFSPAPANFAMVSGDSRKFSSHHWIPDGYLGGIKDFAWEVKNPETEVNLTMEGHALIEQNDYGALVRYEKKDLGYFQLDYTEFRKYFDNVGGVFKDFTTLRVNETHKELQLDIGKLELELGLTLENWPEIVVAYEREFKDGAKSRLTWTPVISNGVTRNIGPSWQDIDEIVDVVEFKANDDFHGFHWKGEQSWEFVRSELSREEKSLSDTGTAADQKIRVQEQDPQTQMMTTTFEADRWFYKDKGHFTLGYRYVNLHNQETEDIFEMNNQRVPTNFSASSHNVRNARSDNDLDNHIWVSSLTAIPSPDFHILTKFKTEVFSRQGNSLYPLDNTPAAPNGIIDRTERSVTAARAFRSGEAISLRYTGIPRVAFYNDLEFEQIRNDLSEDRLSLAGESAPSANESFTRQTITYIGRGIWTLGARLTPCSLLDVTSQVRHRQDNEDYEDKIESTPGSSTARSAFVDWLNTSTSEFSTRVTVKSPKKWIKPSFRYQLRDDDYRYRVEEDSENMLNDMTSHVYTVDVVLQPTADLIATASYSRQNARTETFAKLSTQEGTTPGFDANVGTWLFTADYTVSESTSLLGTLQYSRARNFIDITDSGLPLGADFDQLDLTFGFRWTPGKNLTVEPKYSFYHYKPNEEVEFGQYDAHLIWLDISFNWA